MRGYSSYPPTEGHAVVCELSKAIDSKEQSYPIPPSNRVVMALLCAVCGCDGLGSLARPPIFRFKVRIVFSKRKYKPEEKNKDVRFR